VADADPGHGSGDDDPSVFVLDEQHFDGSLSSTDEEAPGLKTVHNYRFQLYNTSDDVQSGGGITIRSKVENRQPVSCGLLNAVTVSVVESLQTCASCDAHPLGWCQQVMPEIKASGEEQQAAGGGGGGGGGGIAEAASGMKSLLTASSVDETGA
jgi:hypothetical protein